MSSTNVPRVAELALVPRPRIVAERGVGAPIESVVRETTTDVLPPEGFELEITSHNVIIRYGDDNGRRYARATLEQIKAQSSERFPALTIRDWPDFPVRGYLLDISRNRVPTRATLERLVEIMTLARINHFQLDTEHTFAYHAHEVVWREASPLTAADMRWLGDLCRANGIELVANQHCFGHMDRWLRHGEYRHRSEAPGGLEIMPGLKRPPRTLAPTEENAEFVRTLLDELLQNIESRRVNIGCDETVELGRGVSRIDVEQRGQTAVYVDHVRRIADPLIGDGYEVLFWDDMIRDDPSALRTLSSGMIALVWWYSAPREPDEFLELIPAHVRDARAKLGIGKSFEEEARFAPGFSVATDRIAETGFPFWVAPGTASWSSLLGRVDEAVANLLDAAEVGLERGARGYLITDWGDFGHLQPPSVSFGPLIYGGAVSWCLAANRNLDVPCVLDAFVFRDGNAVLGGLLDEIGRMWTKTGYPALFVSPLQAAFHPRQLNVLGDTGDTVKLGVVVDQLEHAMTRLAQATPMCSDADVIHRELHAAMRLARHGAWRLLEHAGGHRVVPVDVLRADLEAALTEQRECWSLRSRPGGLEDSLRPLEEAARALQPS